MIAPVILFSLGREPSGLEFGKQSHALSTLARYTALVQE